MSAEFLTFRRAKTPFWELGNGDGKGQQRKRQEICNTILTWVRSPRNSVTRRGMKATKFKKNLNKKTKKTT